MSDLGNSLQGQWLVFDTFTAKDLDSTPYGGTKIPPKKKKKSALTGMSGN